MRLFGVLLFLLIQAFDVGVKKADQISKAREMVIKAEANKDSPSAGRISMTDNGHLTLLP